MKLEKYVADFVWNIKVNETEILEKKKNWKDIWTESSKD